MPTTIEPSPTPAAANSRSRTNGDQDELTRLKRELLQAEVRLAKSRAGVVGAEADVKVLTNRLRAYSK
ncbi:MAG: hypothetical protein QM760_20960 [Nibricoccus sp.]